MTQPSTPGHKSNFLNDLAPSLCHDGINSIDITTGVSQTAGERDREGASIEHSMSRNPGLLSLGSLFYFVWFSLVTAPGYSSPSSPCYLLDFKQDHSIPGFQPPVASIRSRTQPGSFPGTAAAASPSSFPACLSNHTAFSPPVSRALALLPLLPSHHRIFPDFQTTLTYRPGSSLCSQVGFLSPTSRISAWWSQGLCLAHAAFPAPSMVPDTQKVIKKGFLNQ